MCHSKLIHKLSGHGIGGHLLQWIKSFLSNRTQQTRVGNSLSTRVGLTSSVVQGSVLGPLLFVIFINDVTNGFNNSRCKCKLYADDLKLYTVIEIETDADYATLQGKLDELYAWSDTWQLTISFKKCNVMFIGSHRSNIDFYLSSNLLPTVEDTRDLGVIIDSDLTFTKHINSIVSRAYTRANLIHKCFLSRDVNNLIRAFIVYVRPMLEYASCVWSPHHSNKIKQIETIYKTSHGI